MTDYYEFDTNNYIDYGVKKGPKLPPAISFMSGEIIKSPLPELVFEVNFPKGEQLPHLLGDEVPLVSGTLLEVLKRAGIDNFQIFPANIMNPTTKQTWEGYYAFNVIGLISAANMQASDYDTLMAGSPDGVNLPLVAFRTIVLDEKNTFGLPMFRLAQSPDVILVNQYVVEALKANKPVNGWGIRIVKCEHS
jgi:hypothetical protein